MKTKYTVGYFIKKFKAIPGSQWVNGVYLSVSNKSCALGHCGQRNSMTTFCPQARALDKIFDDAGLNVYSMNDLPSYKFPQKTAKSRILAALEFIKKRAGAGAGAVA